MPLHPVENAALDAHPVLAYPVEIETLTAITDEDLDPVIVDLGVDVDLVGSRMLGGIDEGLAHRSDQCLDLIRRVAVPHHDHVHRHAALVLDFGRGSGERCLQRRLGQLLLVKPAPELAFLAASKLRYRLRIVSMALNQRQGLQHRIVQVRRHIGARVGADLLGAGLVERGSGTVQPGRENNGEAGQGRGGHRHHLGQLIDVTLLRQHDAEGGAHEPKADDDPYQCWPAAPGHERRQPHLAAGFVPPLLLLRRIRLSPHQSGTGAGKGHRPEELLADPEPLVCTSHSRPLPKATRATSIPQSTRRLGLDGPRSPFRLAASRPGAGRGLRWQQQPQRTVGNDTEELEDQQCQRSRRESPSPASPGAGRALYRPRSSIAPLGHPGRAWMLGGSCVRWARLSCGDRRHGGRGSFDRHRTGQRLRARRVCVKARRRVGRHLSSKPDTGRPHRQQGVTRS